MATLGKELERRSPLGLERVDGESTKELLTEFVEESRRMMREEARLVRLEAQRFKSEGLELAREMRQRAEEDLRLAKHELTETASSGARAGAVMAGGGLVTHAALYLLLFAVVFGLGRVMPLWAAALIVGVVTAGVGALVTQSGRTRLKKVRLVPRGTVEKLEGDTRWMSEKVSEKMHALRPKDPGSV